MTVQAPLDGFNYIDYLKLYKPDRLHVDGKGLIQDMLKGLQGSLDIPVARRLAAYLDNSWQPGTRPPLLPIGGLDALDNKLTAREIVMLAKCIVAPLAAIDAPVAEALAGLQLSQASLDDSVSTSTGYALSSPTGSIPFLWLL